MSPREPDFANLLDVLQRKAPARPTLFEMFLNAPLMERLVGERFPGPFNDLRAEHAYNIKAFAAAGYDYATVRPSLFSFPGKAARMIASKSLDGAVSIRGRADFLAYPWPDPCAFDCDALGDMKDLLPGGMKLVIVGPIGVLENVIQLCGYEGLCYMLADDPDLVSDIFDNVGQRMVDFYRCAIDYETVGAAIVNDDWGFKTQTMLSVACMRRYVIPWHKRIVDVIHAAGKPAIMHSCGKLDGVMDDIIDGIGFDGKHSFEDVIRPVEDAYNLFAHRIAIIGGIDVGYLSVSTPEDIRKRITRMLDHVSNKGGWAVGSGNSIPAYVPQENYFAMIQAALEYH